MTAAIEIDTQVSDLVIVLLVVLGTIFWLTLVWWTYKDAKRRIEDSTMIAYATAAAMCPFLGTVIYMIVRPPEYLEDAREREMSIASSQKLIAVLNELQQTQREMHGSIQRLEQAMQASRRRAAQRAQSTARDR